MDLSLRGSQINLAARYKPKPATVKYPIVQRPCSANVLRHHHHRSSPFLRRPMSADEKLAQSLRNCVRFSESVLNENKLWKNKKYMSASSSNIFRFLLEEPIKRSYFDEDTGSTSDSSSLGQKICNAASKQIEPEENSGASGNSSDQMEELISKKDKKLMNRRPKSGSSILNKNYDQNAYTEQGSDLNTDFWHDTKPDLPGRVSFAKSDSNEVDFNDYEPEEQPPPTDDICGNSRKYVHFGESAEIFPEHHPQYDHLLNERCSSSETGSSCNQAAKCFCSFSCNSTHLSNSTEKKSNVDILTLNTVEEQETEENPLIEQYKDEIEDNDKKLELEIKLYDKSANKTMEDKPKTYIASNYIDIANQIFEEFQADLSSSTTTTPDADNTEQNDLSQSNKKLNKDLKNHSSNSEPQSPNNVHGTTTTNIHDLHENSSSVIKNYLRVAEIQPIHRKKQNNLSNTKTNQKMMKTRRTKSATTECTAEVNQSNLKKTGTYTSLRADSKLDEFQIDKVDSWMTLHDECNYRESPEYHVIDNKSPAKSQSKIKKYDSAVGRFDDSSSMDDSTYDEIVSVIKEIEEEKRRDSKATRIEKIDVGMQSTTSLESEVTKDRRSDSPNKLRDIMHYLDDVEHSCDKTIMETRRSIPESSRSEIEFAIEPDIAEDVPKIADLLMLPNHQLARRVVALTLRANELSNAIQLSKQHVVHIRLERQKAIRQEKINMANRLKEQKKHYETIVVRHQGFIEQLLKDKGSLCEKVTALTRRIESQNQAWEHRLETEVNRTKETAVAGEKIRRERWIRENTKKIKELTVKGLEMELNKMTCDHQKEVTDLKRHFQQEILDAVAEERRKHEQLESSIRESCAEDRETTISKERNAIRERFEKQMQEEHKSFDDQKNKLLEDFASERERVYAEMKQKDLDYEVKKQEILQEKELDMEKVYDECRKKFQQQEQKYQTRVSAIEKQFESDFLIWKREFENACKLREVENENAIRQHYRAERDRQIDAIVSKMDLEAQRNQEEYENKFIRLKEKYETDIREADKSETNLREKSNETRNRLAESEARVQNLQAEVKQISLELNHSKKMCDSLLDEKEEMKENARKEVQQEITTIQTERDNEIEKIYKRVQQAIEKKDSAMELLQKENVTLRERCIKLEAIIRQQRKDYCIK